MIAKYLELRDAGTRIDAVAMRFPDEPTERERQIISHGGWGRNPPWATDYTFLARLSGTWQSHRDPFEWPGQMVETTCPMRVRIGATDEFQEIYRCLNPRTLFIAHHWLRSCGGWEVIRSGDVLCVEWILGERDTPKEPELLTF